MLVQYRTNASVVSRGVLGVRERERERFGTLLRTDEKLLPLALTYDTLELAPHFAIANINQ
jgi:hypothetical protein